MSPYGLVAAVLVPLCWVLVSVTGDATGSSAAPRPAVTNSSRGNGTGTGGRGLLGGLGADSSMIQRALYVLIGITGVGVLYFLVRAVRLKRPLQQQKKKYGLLSDYDDSVEMTETMESDEDDTLYEARSLRR